MARRKKSNGNGHDLSARLDSLRDDLGALQRDLRGLLSDAGGAANEQVHEAVKGALSSVEDVAERIEEWGSDNLDSVRDVVRSQPLAAIAISMSAGALLGALFLRR
jgi:ElaB/YqjD/DUF883 family membrane-anchored ribosome-binding protein